MKARLPLATALLLALLAPLPARATTMLSLSTEQLVSRADVVAVARVQQVQVVRNGGRLTTHVQLSVDQPFKGATTGDTLQLLVPGGSDGRFTQEVEGAPSFTAGETCVLFLKRVTTGTYHLVGLEQGKLSLAVDSSGAWMVHRSVTARLVARAPNGSLQEAAPLPETEPAESYFATLRSLAGATP